MAKNNKQNMVPDEEETQTDEGSSINIDELIGEFETKKQKESKGSGSEEHSKKPVRAMRSINADGRLLTAYEALRKEGYTKSFDDFLVDAALTMARDKYGMEFKIEKSLDPDSGNEKIKVTKKSDENNGKNEQPEDEIDEALKLLNSFNFEANPKKMVLETLLEERRLQNEERRLEIERKKLEMEKIKVEIENMKKGVEGNAHPAINENNGKSHDSTVEIYKYILDTNQKFYETLAQMYKNLGHQDNSTNIELLKYIMGTQNEYYSKLTDFVTQAQAEKIRELESYVASQNPSTWLAQKAEEFKTLKEIFGGNSGKTPEEIEKEYQLKLEELRMKHEEMKDEREAKRAEAVTNAIKEGLSSFSQQFAAPLGEAMKAAVSRYTQQSVNTNNNNMNSSASLPQSSSFQTGNTGLKKPVLEYREAEEQGNTNNENIPEISNENNSNNEPENVPLDIYMSKTSESGNTGSEEKS